MDKERESMSCPNAQKNSLGKIGYFLRTLDSESEILKTRQLPEKLYSWGLVPSLQPPFENMVFSRTQNSFVQSRINQFLNVGQTNDLR